MLPVIGRPLDGPIPCAVIRTRGRRNSFVSCTCSSWDFVERQVGLLGDPDSVKQNCKLSGYRRHSPSSCMAATSRPQA
jgi:hypothetical protein